MGSKAVVIKQNDDGPIEDRLQFWAVRSFEEWFANCYTEIRDANGKVRSVTWSTAWRRHRARRSFSGLEFFPNPDGAPSTPGYLNLWRGFAFAPRPKPNGWKTLRDHILTNICAGNEQHFNWVFGFFAHLVQRPRERIGVALVLRGLEGAGKTILGKTIGALFPSHHRLVDSSRYIVGQFNTHLASCLLLQADEAVWAGDKEGEGALKGLITSETRMIEAKGVDPIQTKNYVRVFLTSNEDWVVPAGPVARRYGVFDVDPRCYENKQYFADIGAELRDGGYEALLYDLQTFDLDSVDLRTVPKTAALLEQKERSLPPIKAWWRDRLGAGQTTLDSSEWERSVSRRRLIDDYIAHADRIGVKRKADETTFGREIRRLIPGLREHRPVTVTGRERQYIFPPLSECRDAWDIMMGQKTDWPPEDEDAGILLGEREESRDF